MMVPPFDLLPPLLRGALVTLQVTLASAVVAFLMAFMAGFARMSRHAVVRALTGLYIEIFRGTSLLVQLFWLFFVLPFFGIKLSAFTAGVLALGLNSGAYDAEVVRGAVLAVPKRQTEAAIALNFTPGQRMWRIILPQALVRMLPPFGNSLIELLKASSLISLVAIHDLTFQGYSLRMTIGRTGEVFTLLLVLYFLMAYPLTMAVRWLERRRRWA